MSPRQSHGTLRVLQRSGGFWIWAGFGYTVLHQQAIHPDAVEPVADLSPFEVDRENRIATARKHHDCRTRVLLFWREVQGDRRRTNVPEADDWTTRDGMIGRRGRV